VAAGGLWLGPVLGCGAGLLCRLLLGWGGPIGKPLFFIFFSVFFFCFVFAYLNSILNSISFVGFACLNYCWNTFKALKRLLWCINKF
jgi:hypothetical protein